jgi:WD40 repeat protein
MRVLAFVVLAIGEVAVQTAPELVVSVGHTGAPGKAVFVGSESLVTAKWSNVSIIDLRSGFVTGHLPQQATGARLATLRTPGSTQAQEIAWSPDGRRVVTSADDGVLRFWTASDGRLLAALYILESGGDWLLVAPDGRFDGSDGALATMVAWRAGESVTADRALTDQRRVRGSDQMTQ